MMTIRFKPASDRGEMDRVDACATAKKNGGIIFAPHAGVMQRIDQQ
jgi:hypothetical protein